MPKCDTCGFAHALPDRCINCGDNDPLRRRRGMKVIAVLVAFFSVAAGSVYFYQRYRDIERLAENARLSTEMDAGAPVASRRAARP